MPCHRSANAPGGRAGDRPSCTVIKPTTMAVAVGPCAGEPSPRASPDEALKAASAWVATGGWLSARWPGSLVFAA